MEEVAHRRPRQAGCYRSQAQELRPELQAGRHPFDRGRKDRGEEPDPQGCLF